VSSFSANVFPTANPSAYLSDVAPPVPQAERRSASGQRLAPTPGRAAGELAPANQPDPGRRGAGAAANHVSRLTRTYRSRSSRVYLLFS
jgi:hypothetical protein